MEKSHETDPEAVAAKKTFEGAAALSQDKATKDTPQPQTSAAGRQDMKVGQKMTKNDGTENTQKKDPKDDDINALVQKSNSVDRKDEEQLKGISKKKKVPGTKG